MAIKSVPQRHGEWGSERITEYNIHQKQCSYCKEWSSEYKKPFCPSCGASMALEGLGPARMPISALELNTRPYTCLKRVGKHTVADVLAMEYYELKRIRNLGEKSIAEIIQALEKHGFDCEHLKITD